MAFFVSWVRSFMTRKPIYTIGYGARGVEELIAVLQAQGIDYLIDVRSAPYSRYKPDYNKEALGQRLRESGIRYVVMGDALGGRPADPDCYTEDDKVDYDKVREKPFYKEGIGRLAEAWDQQLAVVIMCSEGKPESCHRSILIGATLEEGGIEVAHIDENGLLLSQEEVRLRRIGGQPSLFGPSFHKFTSRKKYKSEEESGSDNK